MKYSIRWIFALIIVFLFSFTPFTEALAAPELEVKASAGFQNKVKYGLGLPLSLTVVNSGDEFSGDLVIDYSESYAVGSAKAIPFTIGQGETKTINLSLSGLSDEYMYSGGTNSNQMFYFYEGGWEKDKEVKYNGNKSVRPTFYGQESAFILTLTESADRLRPFSSIKLNNMSDTQVIHLAQLKDFELPLDASSYGIANFLVVDEFVLADLPEDAQKAILEWVQTGGIVIVGASENTSAELGTLSSELPLTLSDERTQVPKEVFAALAKNKEFAKDVSAFNATVSESSRVLLASENQPLSAVKTIGKGAIIQTAFSLGDDPFSKESNATVFLTELIKKSNVGLISTTSMNYGYQGKKEQMAYDVGQTNELFPSFQVSTSIMVAIVILYIILVGPLMYFLLKRKDKREHAWWIIPVISILTSAAIFAYGAKDRLVRPQIQQSSFYEVQDDESLAGYYVESLLSNRSGDFTFESETGTTMVASKQMNAFSGGTGSAQATSILQEHANKDQLTMRDVGYWSVSTVIGDSLIPDMGKFTIDLTVESGNVRGTVKNDFPFALKEVSIWSGTKMINLGDLNPNETVKVAEPIGSALLLPIASTTGTQQMGYGSPMSASDLPKERKDSLIRMTQTLGNRSTQPAIIAHTEDAIVPISLKDARSEISAVNVIYQKFEPKTIFSGEFTLPATSFEISVNNEDPSVHFEQLSDSTFEWFMPNGSYVYNWKVPTNVPLDQVNWTELQLANTNTSSITVEIYNVSTETFEEVKAGRFSINKNVQDYITKDGFVQFNVNKQASNGDDYTRLPELRLKGEVKK